MGLDGIIHPDGKYLVFEKMQIKSVDNRGTFDETNPNIYFHGAIEKNNIVDLTDEFDKIPTFEEVEKHLYKILDNNLSFETKNNKYKIDIKQTEQKRNDNKPTKVLNKLTKKGNPKKLNQSAIKRNNKYLKVIEKLIANSELKRNQEQNTDGYPNNKQKEKPHVKQYFNFDVPVAIGETLYTVRLQAEEWFDDKPKNGVKTVHLYNIYEHKKSSRLIPKDKMSKKTREDNDIIKQKKQISTLNSNQLFTVGELILIGLIYLMLSQVRVLWLTDMACILLKV